MRNVCLVATIQQPKLDNGLFGYQLGSTETGRWQPLVVCSTQFKTFQEACDAAERQLAQVDRAIAKRYRKNLQKKQYARSSGRFDGGPGAA